MIRVCRLTNTHTSPDRVYSVHGVALVDCEVVYCYLVVLAVYSCPGISGILKVEELPCSVSLDVVGREGDCNVNILVIDFPSFLGLLMCSSRRVVSHNSQLMSFSVQSFLREIEERCSAIGVSPVYSLTVPLVSGVKRSYHVVPDSAETVYCEVYVCRRAEFVGVKPYTV